VTRRGKPHFLAIFSRDGGVTENERVTDEERQSRAFLRIVTASPLEAPAQTGARRAHAGQRPPHHHFHLPSRTMAQDRIRSLGKITPTRLFPDYISY